MAYTLDQLQGLTNANPGQVGTITAINPRTGQREAVYGGVTQTRFDEDGRPLPESAQDQTVYFASDTDRLPSAAPMVNQGFVGSWGSGFDQFMGDFGVPAGLAAIAGGGALDAFGSFGADAGAVGADGAAGTGGIATGGEGVGFGGSEEALGGGLTTGSTGLTAGSTGAGGITGSIPGMTYAGETLYPVIGGTTAGALSAPSAAGVLGTGLTAGQLGSLASSLIPAGLGLYGSNELGNTLHDINQTNRNDRLPYLTASQGYLTDPSSYYSGPNSPGMTAINGALRGLSVTGNPFGSPFKMEMAADAGMKSWRDAVLGLGGLGVGGETNSTNLGIAGAQADASGLNAIGYGLNNYLNPPLTLADLYRKHSSDYGVT